MSSTMRDSADEAVDLRLVRGADRLTQRSERPTVEGVEDLNKLWQVYAISVALRQQLTEILEGMLPEGASPRLLHVLSQGEVEMINTDLMGDSDTPYEMAILTPAIPGREFMDIVNELTYFGLGFEYTDFPGRLRVFLDKDVGFKGW